MTRKSIHILILLIGWSLFACSGQNNSNASSEEVQQFQTQIDEWMKPYQVEKRDEFDQWIALILDNPTMALEHNVYKHMQTFIYKHTTLRGESLSKLPDLSPDQWNTYPQDALVAADDVRQEMNIGFFEDETQLPIDISIYHLDALEMFHSVENVLSRHAEHRPNRAIYHWLLGYDIAAQEVEKDKWEIHFFLDDYAFRYIWNIAMDEISGLMVKSK